MPVGVDTQIDDRRQLSGWEFIDRQTLDCFVAYTIRNALAWWLARSGLRRWRRADGGIDVKILYLDMDNVLVDFASGIDRLSEATRREYEGRLDEVPGIFALMDPMPGAIEAYQELSRHFDTYILSTAPWRNPTAWSDKNLWVRRHLDDGRRAEKRLILSHHKHLNQGDFLVDDRPNNGTDRFHGQWIQFGTPQWPDWETVTAYLLQNA